MIFEKLKVLILSEKTTELNLIFKLTFYEYSYILTFEDIRASHLHLPFFFLLFWNLIIYLKALPKISLEQFELIALRKNAITSIKVYVTNIDSSFNCIMIRPNI